MPAPRTDERPPVVRPSEAEAEAEPRPIPRVIRAGPCVWRGPPDVARWRGRVGRHVIIEVNPGSLHPLDQVHEAGFGIGPDGLVVERAVVPVPVLLELV